MIIHRQIGERMLLASLFTKIDVMWMRSGHSFREIKGNDINANAIEFKVSVLTLDQQSVFWKGMSLLEIDCV